MVTVEKLAKKIESDLNAAMEAYDAELKAFERCTYRFNLCTDTGTFRRARRENNAVESYINALVSVVDSNVESTQGGKRNISLNVRMEFLVPVMPDTGEEETPELVKTIREIFNAYFAQNTYGTFEGEQNKYEYGAVFSIAASGVREQNTLIGDSFTFVVYGNYFFMQDGLNSRNVILKIEGVPVDYTLLGFRRGSDQEANVPSDTENGATTNITTGTVFSINFSAPVFTDALQKRINDYSLRGKVEPLSVELVFPEDGNASNSESYNMVINSVETNMQQVSPVTCSVALVESEIKKVVDQAPVDEVRIYDSVLIAYTNGAVPIEPTYNYFTRTVEFTAKGEDFRVGNPEEAFNAYKFFNGVDGLANTDYILLATYFNIEDLGDDMFKISARGVHRTEKNKTAVLLIGNPPYLSVTNAVHLFMEEV